MHVFSLLIVRSQHIAYGAMNLDPEDKTETIACKNYNAKKILFGTDTARNVTARRGPYLRFFIVI